jgi:predicted O-linked N-acetylglucosamine transferase (SPINDLY family)
LAPGLHSNYLSCLQHTPGVTPAELAAAHAEWNRRHAEPLRGSWQPHPNTPDPERPVRIGFVSADLGSHPVGYFTVRLFEHLDPRQCLTFCYSFRSKEDDLSRRIAQSAGAWRNVYSLSIEQLAAQIRADGIDILFDLAGHTSNRLTLFARKPAPIQISWAGYVGTTGIKAMDYVLADRHHVPPEMEPYYQEKVLRMPDGYVCYDPPAYAPEVGPLPAAANGYVTFGSFNRLAKTTPEVVDVFCRVLKRVPDARMIVKFTGLDGPSTNRRYAEMFAQRGIDPQRLELLGNSPHAELLAQYNRIDVALDTFPYSGGLVTCEALWMGVPVITCPGQTFAGRHSLSHLTNAGLPELVAQDLDDYVQRAVALAGDRPRLAALRAALRSQVAASPLCDGRRFAANFARLMREVWCAWCANRR